MKTQAKLWFWNLRDAIIFGTMLTVSAVSLVKLGWIAPLAVTFIFAFLSIRMDESSVLDFIRRAVRFFITEQQYFIWKEHNKK
jgi:hypothetical protein